MVTTPREIRVVASPASTAWNQAFEIVINPVLCFTLLGGGISQGWKPQGAGEYLLTSFFVLITMLSSHLAILRLVQCRQVWRFEEDAAILMTGSRSRSIPYQGLSLHPHWTALFAWVVMPDGSRKLVPLPGDGGGREAFLAEMSRRGVEIRFKSFLPSGDPQPVASLRSRIKDPPISFSDDEGWVILVMAFTSACIGWGVGWPWIGAAVGLGLTLFSLMLYPNAWKLVKKRASDFPLNELLYDVRFESGTVTVDLLTGLEWEADLSEVELVQEERLIAGGLYEHRLGLMRGDEPLLPLTVWGGSAGKSTEWIRGALIDRGVPLRHEVRHER